MTDPLDQMDAQLREAGEKWRSTRSAPMDRINPALFVSAPESGGSRTRAVATFVAIAAVTVVAVLIIVSLPPRTNQTATSSPSPSAKSTQPISTTRSSSPPSSQPPSPSPSTGAASWQVLGADQLTGVDGYFGLYEQDGEFLADAYKCSQPRSQDQIACDGQRMLIESSDGVNWNVIAQKEGGQYLSHFYRGNGYFLAMTAFDTQSSGGESNVDHGPWYSTDGTTWESLSNQSAFDGSQCGQYGPYLGMNFIIDGTTPTGLLATALVYCQQALPTVAYTSPDGHYWTAIDQLPVDTLASGHGIFVGADPDDISMHSVDGLDWQQGGALSGSYDLAPVADGFVGLKGDGSLTTSSDGSTWTPATQQLDSGVEAQTLSSDERIAVALDNSDTRPSEGVWASSADGSTWTRYELPLQEGGGPDFVAIAGNRVVALGHTTFANNNIPMAWVGDIPIAPSQVPTPSPQSTVGPSATPDIWTSIGAASLPQMTGGFDSIITKGGEFEATTHQCVDGSCTYALVDSQNGVTWTQVASLTLAMPANVQMSLFHDDQAGFLASTSTIPPGAQGVGLWYSPDGTTWTNAGDEAAFTENPCGQSIRSDASISEIYRAGTVLVARGVIVCTDRGFGRLWTSTDGQTWTSAGQPDAEGIVTGHDVFVASNFDREVGILFSSDGIHWTNAKGQPSLNCSKASIASGFLGVCVNPFGENLSTSADGRTWQTQTAPPDMPVGALSSDGQRAVTAINGSGIFLSSTDGLTWTRYALPNDEGQLVDAAAILGDRVVLWSYEDPRIWIADIPAATP